jgi:flagellin-like hook-associated protein FlgL
MISNKSSSLSALLSSRSLQDTTTLMGGLVRKLSSGLRVSSAADGAADLSISKSLGRQSAAISASKGNALDAISMIQSAEQGIGQSIDMLQRMKDLSGRLATDTLSSTEKKSISQEIEQLANAVDEIANSTKYNQNRLLSGDMRYVKRGEFVDHPGRISSGISSPLAQSDVHSGGVSYSDLAGASTISLNSITAPNALAGTYSLTNSGSSVTLTRTIDGETTQETVEIVSGAPGASNEFEKPTSAGDTFGITFDELGVSLSFDVDSLGTLTNPEDWATLISSVGQQPRATGWTNVSSANWATPGSDTVTAIVSSSRGNLRISTATGLSEVSGYGASSTWTDGSSDEIALIGTADDINAALATLQVDATTGVGQITVAIAPQFGNAGFSQTNVVSTSGNTDFIPGWEIHKERAILGQTVIAGYTSPVDTSRPAPAPAENNTSLSRATYAYGFPTTGTNAGSLWLHVDSVTIQSYGVLHGPYIVSQDAIDIEAGDTVTFNWRSQNGGDDYDSYAYLQEVNTGAQIELLNSTGNITNWANRSVTINTAGSYKFVFLAGTFDASGGTAAGGSLYLDDIQVTSATPKPGTIRTINIATGGSFVLDKPLFISSVSTEKAFSGQYRLVANAQEGTATLNRYDPLSGKFVDSETIRAGLLGSKESLTLDFAQLGVKVSVQNQADFSVRLGDSYSGLASEYDITESATDLLVQESNPVFQTGERVSNTNTVSAFSDIAIRGNLSVGRMALAQNLSNSIDALSVRGDWSTSTIANFDDQVSSYIVELQGQRGVLGSLEYRMEKAISVLDAHASHIDQAQQNISGVDYGATMSALMKQQLTTQAISSIMTHVNMEPNVVKALLLD